MTEIDGEKTGIKQAVSELHNPNDPVPGSDEGEQLALLPLCELSYDASGEATVKKGRGAGRPAGSKNKNTKEWADYILSKYASPLEVLAKTYSRPVELLAAELNCSRLEAYKVQVAAARELSPYIHQKQPTAIDVGENGLISLSINTGQFAGEKASDDDLQSVEILNSKIIENQPLSESEKEKSNVSKSNENAESIGNASVQDDLTN